MLSTNANIGHHVYYPRLKLVFCGIRKAASTSIKEAIKLMPGSDCRRIMTTAEVSALLDLHPEIYSFSVVRHPAERLVSFWNHQLLRDQIHRSFEAMGMYPRMSLEDLVDLLHCYPDCSCDPHVASQESQLVLGGRLVPRRIFRFEALDFHWGQITDEIWRACGDDALRLPGSLPWCNRKDHAPWWTVLSPTDCEKVRDRFAPDFERFGYNGRISS